MTIPPICVLFTEDERLTRRATAFLEPVADVKQTDSLPAFETALEQYSPALLILELNAEGVPGLLLELVRERTQDVIIVIGVPRSEPARRAEALGVYSVEPAEMDRLHFQATIRQATAYLRLLQQNDKLRGDLREAEVSAAQTPAVRDAAPNPEPMRHFSRAFRHFEDLPSVLDSIVEGIASFARVSRAGVFAIDAETDVYKLKAGIKCFEDTRRLSVPRESPLVRWLEIHAHAITRKAVAHEDDTAHRLLLQQSLDALGADVLLPLHGRERLIGWIFLGRHVTGEELGKRELEELMVLADNASLTLENALLYREVRLQKTLAETVLHAVPIGIVAIDAARVVRWYNATAEHILDLPATQVLNLPVARVGSRLSDLLCKCLEGTAPCDTAEWMNKHDRRTIAVDTRRLHHGEEGLGAVAIIRDLTRERQLRDKQDRVERATFWTELAAAISHEVRNPLVAISTFAQLLPERYDDPEFRTEFSQLATSEIGRLDRMIDQIDGFANPPDLAFGLLSVEDVLRAAISQAHESGPTEGTKTELTIESALPAVRGDRSALTGCFAHLMVNSMEALVKSDKGVIRVAARRDTTADGVAAVVVEIQDNAGGIPLALRDKVFSPFCTSKARGIGLGLPIARRTVADHGGLIEIETTASGTCTRITLPCKTADSEGHDETHPGG